MKTYKFEDNEIVEIVKNGGVIALPTETVYGLGVKYSSKEAFDNLVKAKNRNPDKPFTLMLSSKEEIEKYAFLDDKIKRVIDMFVPGEITLLLKPKNNLFPWVTLNSSTIGIRVSGLKEVGELIKRVGEPMLITSANISSFPSCLTYEETKKVFDNRIDAIIEGKTLSSIPSTIVICDEKSIKLIRQGNIPFEEIEKIWKGE